jgi:hypothetical protein
LALPDFREGGPRPLMFRDPWEAGGRHDHREWLGYLVMTLARVAHHELTAVEALSPRSAPLRQAPHQLIELGHERVIVSALARSGSDSDARIDRGRGGQRRQTVAGDAGRRESSSLSENTRSHSGIYDSLSQAISLEIGGITR